METRFKNGQLRRQVSSKQELRKEYGPDVAKQVRKRILQLEGVANLEELCLLPGNWKPLKGKRGNQYSAHLPNGLRLIIRPNEPKTKEDGSIDQRQVKSITVIEITNYHQKE